MKTNENIEKAYDLVERFEFSELSEQDKSYILSVMTESEYHQMRTTLMDIKNSFENDVEPGLLLQQSSHRGNNRFIRFINYPVQLYKVAVSILIVVGLYALYQDARHDQLDKKLSAGNDAVVVHSPDTIFTKVYDTIRIVTTRIIYTKNEQKQSDLNTSDNRMSNFDCNKELCPNELDRIKDLTLRNNITNDSILKDFFVTLN
jgi:hypothetical protein